MTNCTKCQSHMHLEMTSNKQDVRLIKDEYKGDDKIRFITESDLLEATYKCHKCNHTFGKVFKHVDPQRIVTES